MLVKKIVFCVHDSSEELFISEITRGDYWFLKEDKKKRMIFNDSIRYSYDIVAFPSDIIKKINFLYNLVEFTTISDAAKWEMRVT